MSSDRPSGEPNEEEEGQEEAILLLRNEFEAACARVTSDNGQVLCNDDIRLRLYALYSTVTKGKACTTATPSMLFNPVAYAKWAAWSAVDVEELSKTEAMRQYLKLVEEHLPSSCSSSPHHDDGRGDDDGVGEENGFPKQQENNASLFAVAPPSMGFDVDEQAAHSTHCEEATLDALSLAAAEGDESTVLQLVTTLTNVERTTKVIDKRDGIDGMTALMRASDRGHLNCVQILLRHDADPNAQDSEGLSSLHYAVLCQHVHVIKMLVKAGAQCRLEDSHGCHPLHLAEGSPQLSSALLLQDDDDDNNDNDNNNDHLWTYAHFVDLKNIVVATCLVGCVAYLCARCLRKSGP